MSRRPPSPRSARGFTLLELLMATAVAAVVLIVIHATFFSALRLHHTTHERIDHDLEVQRALAIVRRDLAGIVVPGNPQSTANTFAGQLQTETFTSTTMDSLGGERISPDIYTSSGRIDGWTAFPDVQMVAYFLVPDAGGASTKTLTRVVTRNLLPVTDAPGDDQALLARVTSATMSFFDGSDWVASWDSAVSNSLPAAIKLSLELAPRDRDNLLAPPPAPIELVVPVLVATRTTVQETVAAATSTTGQP